MLNGQRAQVSRGLRAQVRPLPAGKGSAGVALRRAGHGRAEHGRAGHGHGRAGRALLSTRC